MKDRRWGWRLLAAVLIVVALAYAVPMGLNALGAALITDDPLHPAGAILVLSGESREGDRVLHAIALTRVARQHQNRIGRVERIVRDQGRPQHI